MNIHIFKHDKFAESYIKKINEKFDRKNQIFLVFNIISYISTNKLKRYSNVILLRNENELIKELEKLKRKKAKFFLHGLYYNKKFLLYLVLNKKIVKNSYWVMWGSDLYYYRDAKKFSLYEFLRRIIISNLKGFITFIYGDFKLLKKWYRTKAKYYYGYYPYLIDKSIIKSINDINDKKNFYNNIKIIIGNSADPSNRHSEILNALKKYSCEDIEIYCPLSYGCGSKEYVKNVINLGNFYFGDRFIPMLDFIPYDEYIHILKDIDIAIFNHNRQQAMGNILTLLYLKKKIYISDNITTWSFMMDNHLNIRSIKNIQEENFEEFTSKVNVEENKNILEDIFNDNEFYKCWSKIFE